MVDLVRALTANFFEAAGFDTGTFAFLTSFLAVFLVAFALALLAPPLSTT